jgi:hypothetical protein
VPTNGPLAAGVLAGHQPAEPHELARTREPAPVADSAASVSAPSRVTPRSALRRATCSAKGGRSYQPARSARPRPAGRGGIAAPPGGARSCQQGRAHRTAGPAASVGARGSRRWRRRATPGPGPAGTCSAGAERGCGQRPCRRGCGTDPAPLGGDGGDADSDQLAGAVPPSQPPAVTLVGLGPCQRALLGVNDGAITWQPTPMRSSSRASSKPVGPASSQARSPRGLPRRPTSLRTDGSSWGIRSTSGTCWSGSRIATEIVSRWTSRPRRIGARQRIVVNLACHSRAPGGVPLSIAPNRWVRSNGYQR